MAPAIVWDVSSSHELYARRSISEEEYLPVLLFELNWRGGEKRHRSSQNWAAKLQCLYLASKYIYSYINYDFLTLFIWNSNSCLYISYSNLIICIISYIYSLAHLYGIGLTLHRRVSPMAVANYNHGPLRTLYFSSSSIFTSSSSRHSGETQKKKGKKRKILS